MWQLPPRVEIFAVSGLRLGDYWKSKGGPEAYYGLGVELSQQLYDSWYVRSTSLAVSMRHELLWGTGPNSTGLQQGNAGAWRNLGFQTSRFFRG